MPQPHDHAANGARGDVQLARHGAVVDGTVPGELDVTARTVGGVIMGLRHREYAVEGVQFHPESVLTQGGHRMLANWLDICGDAGAAIRVPALEADVERLRLSAV